MVYLDYNATAPFSVSVQEYLKNQMVKDWANPSSEHDGGYILAQKIKGSRGVIADFLGVSSSRIFFTSGATESINTVLSIDTLKKNKIETIISSKLEHHATLHRLEYLEQNDFEVLYVKNDENGIIDQDHLMELMKSSRGPCLASFLYVNNETGVINDASSLVKLCRENDCLIHIDAVQALGKIRFDLSEIDPDFASFSAHKIGGLKGIGLLYADKPKTLAPILHGGAQEKKYRPGTLNYPAIHTFRLAIEDVNWEKVQEVEELRNKFEEDFLNLNSKFFVNGSDAQRVANTSSLYLGGVDSKEILLNLSAQGIYISTGSACTSGSVEPSHVLLNMGVDRDMARSCVRISMGQNTSSDDLGLAIDALKKLLK